MVETAVGGYRTQPGLGFGMQEIFSNFISGLIILFEKPIRIGDTVTIRNLTGTVTKINTRATTISDWDRKEIIVPNKAFITEQFVNWSLSDNLTRVVLTVPAPGEANSEEVTKILMNAAERCSLVLDNPAPEVYGRSAARYPDLRDAYLRRRDGPPHAAAPRDPPVDSGGLPRARHHAAVPAVPCAHRDAVAADQQRPYAAVYAGAEHQARRRGL